MAVAEGAVTETAVAELMAVANAAAEMIETGLRLVAQGTSVLKRRKHGVVPRISARRRFAEAELPSENRQKMPRIGSEVDAEAGRSPAPNTLRQYDSHWGRYQEWLNGAAPTEETLTRYQAHLYETGRSAGTIALAVAGIRWHALRGECPLPGSASRACLAGIRSERVARKSIPELVGAATGTPASARLSDRQLDVLVKRLSERSLARRTKEAYAAEWGRFLGWLGEGTPGEKALCRYVAHLYQTGKSAATANLAVAAVRHHARERGIEIPKDRVGECLAGFRREAPERGLGQVAGLKWEQVDRMCAGAEADGSVKGRRDAALIAVMSDALLRVSDASKLEVSDIRFMADGSGRVLIRQSKTDRGGKGFVQYLGPSTVERVRAWLAASGVGNDRLFRHLRRGGHAAPGELGDRSIRKIIIERARAIGVEERVSSHSLRVGAAQSLAERNTSLVGMQRAGNWASPSMPAYYTREQEAGFGFVARLRYGVGDSTS